MFFKALFTLPACTVIPIDHTGKATGTWTHTHLGRLLIFVSLDLSPRVLNLKGVKEETDIIMNTHENIPKTGS